MARSHSSTSPELWAHQQWLGFVQPVGLVVSLPALEKAQCYVNKNVTREQLSLLALAPLTRLHSSREEARSVRDFRELCRELLGWQDGDLVAPPPSLEVALVNQNDHLMPTFAVPSAEGDGAFQALVMCVSPGTALDEPRGDTGWRSTPQERIERLLHETGVAIGVLFNGVSVRLIHAPRCEAVGHVTFPVAAMAEPAGRPILGAFLMLLGADRVFNLPPPQRLPAILRDSRRYQNEVSTRLADQVLGALHELLRGFQAADQAAKGAVLGPVLRDDPAQIYGGLLTTLLRLVFLLYAEDWDLISADPVYVRHYSVTALFEKLREDASRFVDTMDQRFGAWSRLLSLFRLIFDGGKHGDLALPARLGQLFDPDAFPFLEGRAGRAGTWQRGEQLAVPRVSDGCLFRVLEKLLVLDGDRLSYRALEVEQIGSVYEAIMGFTVEQTSEPAVALRPHHVVVGLASLLKKSGADRLKFLADEARCKVSGKAQDAVKSARTTDDLAAALGKSLSPRTPDPLPLGTLVLQPTEERRRSGSHYTPRSLTEPIVEKTLGPVLKNLTPPAPLSLKGEGGGSREGAAGGGRDGRGGVTRSVEVAPEKLARARGFRKSPTAAEAEAWELLRDRRCLDLKFRRQQVIAGFIVDFYCASLHLALELDGPIHDQRREYDEVRDAILAREGIQVLRLPNEQLSASSLRALLSPLASPPSDSPPSASPPSPPSALQGEGGRGGEVSLPPTPEQILSLKVCDPAMGSGAFLVAACDYLARRLEEAWSAHGAPPDVAASANRAPLARRLVAQCCLYGVDKNPLAVNLAKLSLWLFTLSKDQPFTFLDHALRHGDSLLGLSREQIASFHWAPEKQVPTLRKQLDDALTTSVDRRREIHALAASPDNQHKGLLLKQADEAISHVRHAANLVIEAYLAHDKDKDRKEARKRWETLASTAAPLPETPHADAQAAFHWELEFPEVFARENPGFDAFVGNPPFAGKNTISSASGDNYIEWLKVLHEGAHGNADLVAHFFRRAFNLLRPGGTLGLISTNTIAQGDTRSTGLRWICEHDGVIYDATQRLKWPGLAAVVVSVVHIAKSPPLALQGEGGRGVRLNNRHVPQITAYLFDKGTSGDPTQLQENAGKSFQGSIVLGMGFTFDDSNDNASPLAEMHRLIAQDPRNQERIFPYLGGEELNSSPTQSHHRFVINFGQMSEEEARQWPDLMAIVEKKVKPERLKNNREGYRKYWWHHGGKRIELYQKSPLIERVLARSLTSKHHVFSFINSRITFDQTLIVFLFNENAALDVLSSRIHESWARFFGATMKDDPRYNIGDCFETFPFPQGWQEDAALEAAGKEYYEFRASLMADEAERMKLMEGLPPEGLTATYNRFHDPDCRLPGIVRLRELHGAMDRAVLAAYGWGDVPTGCEFLLDYEEEEEEDEGSTARKKKKPWRFRWPDEVRDDVLARLLALNAERAAAEKRLGEQAGLAPRGKKGKAKALEAGAEAAPAAKKGARGKKKDTETGQQGLLGDEEDLTP